MGIEGLSVGPDEGKEASPAERPALGRAGRSSMSGEVPPPASEESDPEARGLRDGEEEEEERPVSDPSKPVGQSSTGLSPRGIRSMQGGALGEDE